MSAFASLNLLPTLQTTLSKLGYQTPTPIQSKAIPPVLAGNDLVGIAQTGTGKTAAFALPALDRLSRTPPVHSKSRVKPIRLLVLTPTRELASQVSQSFQTYGNKLRLNQTVIFGGVGQGPQTAALRRGVDILVATPGRLLDLMNQGFVRLDGLEMFILDEADRMLDMGFIHDIRKVMKALPKKRQTLLFSATWPAEIARLADGLMTKPVRVEATPNSSTVERIDQQVMLVEKNRKIHLLQTVLDGEGVDRALVFTRTKHGADRVVRVLTKQGVAAAAIHGNKSQNARTRALSQFKSGEARVLVATDIAARGIDVQGVSHVINFDMPEEPENYVHRIGRTARAGRAGVAISFCDASERGLLNAIQRINNGKTTMAVGRAFPGGETETEVQTKAGIGASDSRARGAGQQQPTRRGEPAPNGPRRRRRKPAGRSSAPNASPSPGRNGNRATRPNAREAG